MKNKFWLLIALCLGVLAVVLSLVIYAVIWILAIIFKFILIAVAIGLIIYFGVFWKNKKYDD